jgi:sec-independent protein translocase protein TatA
MGRNLLEHPLFLIILVGLVAVLFGGKRLPEAARGLGRSLRIFKSEVKQMQEDDKPADSTAAGAATSPVEGRVVDTPLHAPAPVQPAAPVQQTTPQRDEPSSGV